MGDSEEDFQTCSDGSMENDNDLHGEDEEQEEEVESDDQPSTLKNKKNNKIVVGHVGKRGVCYLSRVPRKMDHVKLRHILSRYADIERIYLVPENPSAEMQRKLAGGYRGKQFSEGWVEFAKKSAAKRVARMLNGQQMGGKRRSAFYYDIWNIKYLKRFKWDDLTEEIAYKHAVREQKLALELSAAKRERDFYLSKVDQSRALSHIHERAKKKQKTEAPESNGDTLDNNKLEAKVIRQFPQNRPVTKTDANKKQSRLSKEILSEVFGQAL